MHQVIDSLRLRDVLYKKWSFYIRDLIRIYDGGGEDDAY